MEDKIKYLEKQMTLLTAEVVILKTKIKELQKVKSNEPKPGTQHEADYLAGRL